MAPEAAGKGGIGDAADGEVEAGVSLGVQVIPQRDPGPRGAVWLGRSQGGRRRDRTTGHHRGCGVGSTAVPLVKACPGAPHRRRGSRGRTRAGLPCPVPP